MSLKGIMTPKSVALVGATERPGFGSNAAQNLMSQQDRCPVWFVNPTKTEVFGKPCYPNLTALPEKPDCVVIAVARDRVNPYLEEAGKLGITSAVVYASGYTEEHSPEGAAAEAEMKAIAEKYGISILGPNCMGIINKVDNLTMMGMKFNPEGAFPGVKPCVAMMGHSGALLANMCSRRGFPLAYMISVGNGTVTTMEDFMMYCADDPNTKIISLYVEGLKKPDLFVAALKRCAENRKPVIILKTGRTARTAASAASHTGSMAGSFASFTAMCKKMGVIMVDSVTELTTITECLAIMDGNYPHSPKLMAMNASGGQNTLTAESIEANSLETCEISEGTRAAIQQFLPSFATIANPLDTTTALLGDPERMLSILREMEKDDGIGLISAGCDIGENYGDASDKAFAIAMLKARDEGLKKPYFLFGLVERTKNDQWREEMAGKGICIMPSLPTATKCLKKMLDFIFFDSSKLDINCKGVPATVKHQGSITLTETESKQTIAAAGIRIPKATVITSAAEVDAHADYEYPVVMKISSPDIPHKTEAKAVKINIRTPEEAKEAFDTIVKNSLAFKPDARIEGVLFQEMAPAGTEMIMGVSSDPQLGPMVLVGLGGIYAEVFRDTALAPCPVSVDEAEGMIRSLKSFKMLDGFRGGAKLDIRALADAVSKLSHLADEKRDEIREIDINPIFVYEKGICAADALVVKYEK